MTIKVGDKIPAGTMMTMGPDGPKPVSSDELFAGKKVVLFGLPGAFTPTCSAKHLPGYVEKAGELKAKGVDTIACMSVNDAFVMNAWGKDQKVGDAVMMLADGSADYAKALGLDLDLTARGMGMRARRFSMLVEDGVVKAVNIEENPGEAKASGAETMLSQL
jgi:peroxiredoxin